MVLEPDTTIPRGTVDELDCYDFDDDHIIFTSLPYHVTVVQIRIGATCVDGGTPTITVRYYTTTHVLIMEYTMPVEIISEDYYIPIAPYGERCIGKIVFQVTCDLLPSDGDICVKILGCQCTERKSTRLFKSLFLFRHSQIRMN